MRDPNIYSAFVISTWDTYQAQSNRYLPARPYSLQRWAPFKRIRLAWGVFIGKFDALDWEAME